MIHKNNNIKANKLFCFSILSGRISLILALLLITAANFAVAATTAKPPPAATQVLEITNFDHIKPGFKLTGAHPSVRCATCHINNVLKGTPRDCATCHMIGNPMGASTKPVTHLNTNVQCDNCHRTLQWTPAFFSHIGLADGSCSTCHDGKKAKGKQNNHMPTNAECSNCHVTISFVAIKASANIPLPTGNPPHIPTTQPCSACHVGASFLPGRMNHIGIAGNCASCHNGSAWMGVTPRSKQSVSGHVVTNSPCETCHTSTSTFLVANLTLPPAGHIPSTQPCSTCHAAGFGPNSGVMSHTGIVTGCSNCHGGQSFPVGPVSPRSKPTTSPAHIPTSMPCETCHSPASTNIGGFAGDAKLTMKHTGIVSGCSSCHNDGLTFAGVSNLVTKSSFSSHMATSQDCSSCHTSTSTFKGASGGVLPAGHVPTTQPCSICHLSGYGPNSGFLSGMSGMNHVGIVTGCISCHNGQTFTVAGAVSVTPVNKTSYPSHIATSDDCYKCHTSTITFTGASPTVIPAGHLPTTQTCLTCHSAGFGSGSGVMNHVGIVTNCMQCHNGQTFAVGMKPVSKANFPTHVATSLDCSSCHSTTNFTSFAGATGGAMPANHLPTSQPCTLCHSAGYSISLTKMSHTGIVSGCASCHNGQTFAVGMKPVTKGTSPQHVPTSMPCETCHSISVFTSFAGTTMKHTGIVSGCASCHSGTAFQGVTPMKKPSNHVPTNRVTNGAACETCHSISNFNTFSGTAMKHTGIADNCVECHGKVGSPKPYIGPPMYEPSNHIPYATKLLGGATMQCEFCHKSTSAFTLGVSSTAMHNGSQGMGSGSCVGCHLSGTNYLGNMQRKSHNGASVSRDCSSSGCHKPLGKEGTAYQSW